MTRQSVLALASVAALAVWLVADGGGARPPPPPPAPTPVILGKAKRQDVPAIIQALGTVQASDTVSVQARVTGRTGQRLVDLGNFVQGTGTTTTLVTITQIKPTYVTFPIPATSLDEVRRHQNQAPLVTEAYAPDGRKLAQGRLTLVNNQVNTTTGTVLMEATLANEDEALWPGAFVDVRLTVSIHKAAVTVPEQTVMAGPDGPYVYVVAPDQTAHRVPVRVAARQDGIAVIEQGLKGGERVVVDGQYRLADNVRVQDQSTGKGS